MNNQTSPALWILVLAAILAVALPAPAQDITRGVTFTDGQRLTASELHELVDQATITTGFYLNKPTTTTLENGAYILVYSPAAQAFEKVQATSFLYGNTSLITGQGEKLLPAANDYLLIYDANGQVLAKSSLGNIWSNNIATLPAIVYTNLSLTGTFVPVLNGTNGTVSLTNLFQLFPYTAIFTNLPVRVHATNFDNLLLAASDDGISYASERISLPGLFTNLPAGAALTNAVPTDGTPVVTNFVLMAYEQFVTNGGPSNSVVVQIPFAQLQSFFTNTFVTTNSKPLLFTSAEIPITNTIMYLDFPHDLPGKPQITRAVLVCESAEADYSAGDEIVFDTGVRDTQDGKYGTYGANSTNLFLDFKIDGRVEVPDKITGVLTTLAGAHGAVVTNWKLKFYATYFP